MYITVLCMHWVKTFMIKLIYTSFLSTPTLHDTYTQRESGREKNVAYMKRKRKSIRKISILLLDTHAHSLSCSLSYILCFCRRFCLWEIAVLRRWYDTTHTVNSNLCATFKSNKPPQEPRVKEMNNWVRKRERERERNTNITKVHTLCIQHFHT